MSRAAITQPTKIYTGTSGNVDVPAGCVLLYLTAVGNGTITGVPDGQGGSNIVSIPNTSQWFIYDAPSLNIVFKGTGGPAGSTSTTWRVVFTGTTSYLMEVMNPGGGF